MPKISTKLKTSDSVRVIDKGNGWKVREVAGDTATDRQTFYYYKNKIAIRIQLNSALAQQLAGYTLIEKDLRNVLAWLQGIDTLFPPNEHPNKTVISPDRERFNTIKGLYVASLTFYGKCFAQCEGRRARLSKKNIDIKFHETHDEILKQRNNYAAHSGADKFEDVKIALVLAPSKNTIAPPLLYRELSQPDVYMSSQDDEMSFIALVEHVRENVADKMKIVADKILHEEVAPLGKAYWYKKANR